MTVRIGINGFGRIGRALARIAALRDDVVLCAANDRASAEILGHLLEHDSVYGRSAFPVGFSTRGLMVGERPVRVFRETDPGMIPWSDEGVEIVVESSGRFTRREEAGRHLGGSVRRVLISATAPDADMTLFAGINDAAFDPEIHGVISTASCTAHALAPILLTLEDRFGIRSAAMTTIHAYTNHQPMLDSATSDPRRSRAGGLSMIPTTTTSIDAILSAFPSFAGRICGMAVRVPTPAVSMIDVTAALVHPATSAGLSEAFCDSAGSHMRGTIGVSSDELVSTDYRGDPRSVVIDLPLCSVSGTDFARIVGWYDNEWGYAARLIESIAALARTERSRRIPAIGLAPGKTV